MKNNKELDYTLLSTEQSDKVIVAFHGWQGNKDSFLPLAKNSLFKDYNWFLLEGPYMVGNDPKRRTWSYEIEPDVFDYEEPKGLIYDFFRIWNIMSPDVWLVRLPPIIIGIKWIFYLIHFCDETSPIANGLAKPKAM